MSDQIDFDKLTEAVPFLRLFAREEVEELMALGDLYQVAKGTALYEQGDIPKGLFILVGGAVTTRRDVGRGDYVELMLLQRGGVVGATSMLKNAPCSEAAVVTEDALVLHFPAARLNEMRVARAPLAYRLLRALAPVVERQAAETVKRVRDIFSRPDRYREHFEKLGGAHGGLG